MASDSSTTLTPQMIFSVIKKHTPRAIRKRKLEKNLHLIDPEEAVRRKSGRSARPQLQATPSKSKLFAHARDWKLYGSSSTSITCVSTAQESGSTVSPKRDSLPPPHRLDHVHKKQHTSFPSVLTPSISPIVLGPVLTDQEGLFPPELNGTESRSISPSDSLHELVDKIDCMMHELEFLSANSPALRGLSGPEPSPPKRDAATAIPCRSRSASATTSYSEFEDPKKNVDDATETQASAPIHRVCVIQELAITPENIRRNWI